MRKPHYEYLKETTPQMLRFRPRLERLVFEQEDGTETEPVPAAFNWKVFDVARQVSKHNETIQKLYNENKIHKGTLLDPNIAAFMSVFEADGAVVYKIGREFGEALKTAHIDISGKYIPATNKAICIEFPDHMGFETKGGVLKSAYVCTYKDDRTVAASDGKAHDKWLMMTAPLYVGDGAVEGRKYDNVIVPFDDDETLEQALERNSKARPVSYSPSNQEFLRYIIKVLLYIHSGDPDLRHMRAVRPSSRKFKTYMKGANPNLCKIDMIHLGFNYKKPKVYMIDGTTVSGHFRWQTWGPQHSLVKLIWIEPHERHYNKDNLSFEVNT